MMGKKTDVKLIFEYRCIVFRFFEKEEKGWFGRAHPRINVSGVESEEERVDKTMHRVLRLRGGNAERPQIQVSLQFTARCRFRRIDI